MRQVTRRLAARTPGTPAARQSAPSRQARLALRIVAHILFVHAALDTASSLPRHTRPGRALAGRSSGAGGAPESDPRLSPSPPIDSLQVTAGTADGDQCLSSGRARGGKVPRLRFRQSQDRPCAQDRTNRLHDRTTGARVGAPSGQAPSPGSRPVSPAAPRVAGAASAVHRGPGPDGGLGKNRLRSEPSDVFVSAPAAARRRNT